MRLTVSRPTVDPDIGQPRYSSWPLALGGSVEGWVLCNDIRYLNVLHLRAPTAQPDERRRL